MELRMNFLVLTFLATLVAFALKEADADSLELLQKRGKSQTPQCNNACRGLQGLPGRDGRDGRDAFLRGKPGARGPRGRRGPKGDLGGSTGGVVYTRWGRKICPRTHKTSLLYTGYMAGSHYSHSGGGSNYICLPSNPIYDKVLPGHQGSSYIYGVEYEINKYPSNRILPSSLHDHDAPCAVCHSQVRGSHVMIPARNVCPRGWTMEYKGYLMAEYYAHKGRTQYVCIDNDATASFGTKQNRNGALLYFVEGACGSLPCRPYVNGYELTCVVCTK